MLRVPLTLFYCIFTNLNDSMRQYVLFVLALFVGLNSIASSVIGFINTAVDFNRNNRSITFDYRDSCFTNADSAVDINCFKSLELILRVNERLIGLFYQSKGVAVKDLSP